MTGQLWLAGFFIALTLLGLGVTSVYALLTVLLDGLSALVVVGPAVGVGLWLVPLFRLRPLPLRWHWLLAAALGLGTTSLLVLLLGLAGVLQRSVWVTILIAFTVAGAARLRTLAKGSRNPTHSRPSSSPPQKVRTAGLQPAAGPTATEWPRIDVGSLRYLWLLACPFLVLALLAASNAPGLIRPEEGFAYDVLEYHLQMPKEYFEAGRISYAPHNVYANFPANVEMLYLLAMIVLNDTVDVGTTANMIHLLLGLLAVFAAWAVGRDCSPRAGLVSGLAMATCGWLVYLSGLAYVENGLLFFGMVATGALLRLVRFDQPGNSGKARKENREVSFRRGGWVVIAGIAAGFACGCKYTAAAMVALPLGVMILVLPRVSVRHRFTMGLAFAGASMVAFSPWLIKNQIYTGNPVFPLLNAGFDAAPPGWGEQETKAWERGHTPKPSENRLTARLATLWRHLPGDHYQRFGPLLILLPIIGLFRRKRDRVDVLLVGVLAIQLAVWLFATHLYARFAVVLLIPLALLAGRALREPRALAHAETARPEGRGLLWMLVSAVVLGATWNFVFAARVHHDELAGAAPASLIYEGMIPGYEYFQVVNRELPGDAKILLVGDARAFYFQRTVDYRVVFNRSPFVEAVRAARSDADIVEWLRSQGFTHVLVHWSEVRRLAGTYGFAREITPGLFRRLQGHGLSLVREFEHPGVRKPYVELWAVR